MPRDITARAALPRFSLWRAEAREPRAMLNYDVTLAWAGLLLLAIGLVMVYSASIAIAEASAFTGYHPWYFLARQALFVAAGLVAASIASQIPLKAWRVLAPYLFVAGAALLVAVLVPGVGRAINGSRRWLPLGVANLQPSEFMKLFVVLYAASYAVRKAAFLHAEQPLRQTLLRGFLPLLAVMVAVGALLLHEPDFGACVVIIAIAFGILFLGGLDWRLLAGLSVLLPVALWMLIRAAPYRLQRFTGFLDPWADAYGKGYQLSHSLIAFGRGEWFGVGLGSSVEKLLYLPEAHTDFLLAVIGEELGFAGVAVVLALFAWILVRAYAIGRQAIRLERPLAALVAHGIGIWLGVQAFINVGVNVGVLPTKGLTLPLLSFGGSGIVANCIAIAILLRVDYENRRLLRGFSA
jgi:cell division protein FtsW